ncbi:hypothetical protein [Limnoraphis robusta]|uniref:CRISPR type III-B/RAMP module-associated protein Cmr5 n=1 Tax=Limnoraphis robusta CS-951 TaxID=1637645 RepID=A0A0F5YL57_9CYAN|nr:hypothetical protein [Limnoraphis robusta]KKD39606.1 hypothetical protein WN50_02425 [Limnoraphis robusta CS-951]
MTQPNDTQEEKGWQPYSLDYYAQEIVLKHRDKNNVLNESHKMRMAVAYGLERFWGEHLRLQRENLDKSQYWKDVWDKLAEILGDSEIILPNHNVTSNLPDKTPEEKRRKQADETKKIQAMAKAIWSMQLSEQRVALMVLTQFCDSLVWWTQRYKTKNN